MHELGADELVKRVARLESTVRRDRTIALAALAILFATAQTSSSSEPVMVRGQNGSTQMTATGMVIRDSAGQQRIFVGMDAEGRPSVDLRDTAGKLRATMFLTSESQAPTIREFDSTGTERMDAYLSKDGFPNFRMNDANGKRRLSAFIGYDTGNPEIAVYGADEEARGYLVGEDCGAYFDIRDQAKNFRAHMGTYPDCSFGMFLRNQAGQNVWAVP